MFQAVSGSTGIFCLALFDEYTCTILFKMNNLSLIKIQIRVKPVVHLKRVRNVLMKAGQMIEQRQRVIIVTY